MVGWDGLEEGKEEEVGRERWYFDLNAVWVRRRMEINVCLDRGNRCVRKIGVHLEGWAA